MPATYGFLPPGILELCRQLLQQQGVDPDKISGGDHAPDGQRLHRRHYHTLRAALEDHQLAQILPVLAKFGKPTKKAGIPDAIRRGFGGEYVPEAESSSDDSDQDAFMEGVRDFNCEDQGLVFPGEEDIEP